MQSEGKSEALFHELLTTPMNFTLDQLLSLVPIFRDRFYSATRKLSEEPLVAQLQKPVESYQVLPEDVDFTIPTVKVEWNSNTYPDVLLDGGSGVNILVEAEFLKLRKARLESAPFQVAVD